MSALSEQMPSQMSSNFRSQKERFERLGVAALGVFGSGILGLLLYGIIYKIMILQGRIWDGLGMLGLMVLFSFGLIAVYLFAKANDVGKDQLPVENEDGAEVINRAVNTRELLSEGCFEPIPSVVENTTELLHVERK
jgi:hypothetical protein